MKDLNKTNSQCKDPKNNEFYPYGMSFNSSRNPKNDEIKSELTVTYYNDIILYKKENYIINYYETFINFINEHKNIK